MGKRLSEFSLNNNDNVKDLFAVEIDVDFINIVNSIDIYVRNHI